MDKAHKAMSSEQLWSVIDFSRRFRLDTVEEGRLLRVFGPFASPADLLRNARRTSPGQLIADALENGGSHHAEIHP